MKQIQILLPILVLVLSPTSFLHAQDPPAPEDVLAVVNGQAVYAQDVEERLQTLHGTGRNNDAAGRVRMEKLLTSVINDVLLGQEARAMGLSDDPAISRKVTSYRERLVLKYLERTAMKDMADPTPEEIDTLFKRRYRGVTLRVVTAYDKPRAQELRRLLDDGADMETLARDESVDPYALRGGLVDEVEQIDLQADISAAAFTLQPGEMAGPFPTDLGYSTIRVEAFHEPTPERFVEVEAACKRLVRMARARQVRTELATVARKYAPVSIDREIVAAVVPRELPDGRLMADAPDPDQVVARIGTTQLLTVQEYTRALVTRWKGVRNREAALAAAPMVLRGLVEDKVLLAEAIRRGYDREPEIQRAVEAFETQILIPRYLQETIGTNLQVSSEQLEAYYQEHKGQYLRPPKIRLGQITVETREEAETLAEQLRKGADLPWLARQKSLDRFADSGGDRGWYTPQQEMEDFNQDLFQAEEGAVLDPFGVPGNFIILKVLARQEQGTYTFKEISGNIRKTLEQQLLLEEMKNFMAKLRSRAEITTYEDRLARLAITADPESSSPSHGDFSAKQEDGDDH